MFELDFFGLIDGAGIGWMAFIVVLTSLFTVLSGAIWPLMENWMEREEAAYLLTVCQEVDVEELERLTREIEEVEMWTREISRSQQIYELLEYEERVNLFSYPWLGRSRWELCVRKIEEYEDRIISLQAGIALLDQQVDAIWSTPIAI